MTLAIEKRNVFISHATTDGAYASAIDDEIKRVFAGAVDVFCTSSPGALRPGADWLNEIEKRLETAHVMIVVVTPLSVQRPWLWFEVGASWLKTKRDLGRMYALCAPEVDKGQLPEPLCRLQALSMHSDQDVKRLFQELVEVLGVGDVKRLRPSRITSHIPKSHAKLAVSAVDRAEPEFYRGKRAGYTDEDLAEVLESRFFVPDQDHQFDSLTPLGGGPSHLEDGRLVEFRQVDESIDLPPGTAKRLLVEVAKRFALAPRILNDNTVRFMRAVGGAPGRSRAHQ